MRFQAPPHLDHWTTALIWLLSAVDHHVNGPGERPVPGDNPMFDGGMARSIGEGDRFFMAHRAIMRCHPLYERFIAANAITEGELLSMMVDKAQGTVRATKELTALPPCAVTVVGLQQDVADEFRLHALRLLPKHFTVDVV
ncbi:hypothetical protein N9917_01410 [Deltaproteobacteria bacterium]|nr:hypothetical protein [Deltaproteobacteria bacterium]